MLEPEGGVMRFKYKPREEEPLRIHGTPTVASQTRTPTQTAPAFSFGRKPTVAGGPAVIYVERKSVKARPCSGRQAEKAFAEAKEVYSRPTRRAWQSDITLCNSGRRRAGPMELFKGKCPTRERIDAGRIRRR